LARRLLLFPFGENDLEDPARGREEIMLRTGLLGMCTGLVISVLGSVPFFVPGVNILDPTTDLIILGALFLLGLTLGVVVMAFGLVMAGTGIGRNHFLSRPHRP
jgi:hypothetical protein